MSDLTSPGMAVAGTLNFAGAGGNAALIDDNSGTSAADPSGYNASTNWSVDLGSGNPQAVTQILVAKDGTFGLTNPATMKLEHSDDNAIWTQAGSNFTLSAGTSPSPESFEFPYAGVHRYWRVHYASGGTGGNFWLQEIQMFSRLRSGSANATGTADSLKERAGSATASGTADTLKQRAGSATATGEADDGIPPPPIAANKRFFSRFGADLQ